MSVLLSGLVVHWHNEAELEALAAAWPPDPRVELVVVDNGSSRPVVLPPAVRWVDPGANLGFAGGVNLAAQIAAGELLLLLNPDAEPIDNALEGLVAGAAAYPEAAGLVPTLVSADGTPQTSWQARVLPSVAGLILLPLLGDRRPGPSRLAPGERVEQPAAAALVLRRSAFERVGGLDPRFRPAWFEDVDLARRLGDLGLPLLAWPEAQFRHGQGASVPRLGYGRFLVAYHHNLERYLERHVGGVAVAAARLVLILGLLLRLVLLPLRQPRRAASRREALAGLVRCLGAALSGWRWGTTT